MTPERLDRIERKEPVTVGEAAEAIRQFLFESPDGNPFGAERFTLDELQEKFLVQPTKSIKTPLLPSDFPGALKFMYHNGLIGYDAGTDTYYDKHSA